MRTRMLRNVTRGMDFQKSSNFNTYQHISKTLTYANKQETDSN